MVWEEYLETTEVRVVEVRFDGQESTYRHDFVANVPPILNQFDSCARLSGLKFYKKINTPSALRPAYFDPNRDILLFRPRVRKPTSSAYNKFLNLRSALLKQVLAYSYAFTSPSKKEKTYTITPKPL